MRAATVALVALAIVAVMAAALATMRPQRPSGAILAEELARRVASLRGVEVVDVGPYTVRLDPDAREVVVSLGGEEWRAEIVGGPPGLIESSGTGLIALCCDGQYAWIASPRSMARGEASLALPDVWLINDTGRYKSVSEPVEGSERWEVVFRDDFDHLDHDTWEVRVDARNLDGDSRLEYSVKCGDGMLSISWDEPEEDGRVYLASVGLSSTRPLAVRARVCYHQSWAAWDENVWIELFALMQDEGGKSWRHSYHGQCATGRYYTGVYGPEEGDDATVRRHMSQGGWHVVELRVYSDHYELYVDGERWVGLDHDVVYGEGMVGIGFGKNLYAGGYARFDWVEVEELIVECSESGAYTLANEGSTCTVKAGAASIEGSPSLTLTLGGVEWLRVVDGEVQVEGVPYELEAGSRAPLTYSYEGPGRVEVAVDVYYMGVLVDTLTMTFYST